MSNWFEAKVKYQKIDEKGKEKNVSELYLVDALSFTEAEARITKEMEAYISGEFNVINLKIASFSELLPSEYGDRWYKAKVAIVSIDEAKGKEKKINTTMLVEARDIKEAFDQIEKYMESSISDYQIKSITESTIMDIFPIHDENPEEIVEEEEVPVVENEME